MEWKWREYINFWFIMILIFWQTINIIGILTPEAVLKGQDFTHIKKKLGYDEINRESLKTCSSPISCTLSYL